MTVVKVFVDQEDRIMAFEVRGHSGFAEHGKDIVCSAVSILTQTAVIGLGAYLDHEPCFELKDGFIRCSLPAKINQIEFERAQIILRTMEMGLEATAGEYRDYLKIVRRRWD